MCLICRALDNECLAEIIFLFYHNNVCFGILKSLCLTNVIPEWYIFVKEIRKMLMLFGA